MKKLRLFISSPGDVGYERECASRVIARLSAEMAGRVELDPYFWEHEPMHAGADFQAQIPALADFSIFIGILWSRLGTRLNRSHTHPDGTPYASGTEYEFETGLEAYRTSAAHTPRLLIYKRDETPLFPAEPPEVRDERTRQWELLKAFVAEWFRDPQDGGTFKAAFNTYQHTAEFEEKLESHLRTVIRDLSPETADDTGAAGLLPITWASGSPYRGLKVFEFEHAAVFFGRTHATDEVVGQLRDRANAERTPFVLIFGSSGSGKSSLLRAGVIPTLVAGGIDGIGLWRRAIMQPAQSTGDLFEGLAAALLKPEAVPELAVGGTTAAQLAERLRNNAAAVGEFLAGVLPQAAQREHEHAQASLREQAEAFEKQSRRTDAEDLRRAAEALRFPEPRLILGLDQLEEMFTQEDRFPAASRIAFIEAIESLVGSGYVWVVATLRSDHFARCEEIPALVKLQKGEGQYHLLPPSRTELGQIIRLPAQAAGVRFEEHPEKGRLEDVLRDAAADDPGALPLLSFSLEQLYETGAADRRLTHDEYAGLGGAQGGLRGVLVKLADGLYEKLSPAAREAFPKVFQRLVSIGSSGKTASGNVVRFSRRNARIEALSKSGDGALEVMSLFGDARLLVTDTNNNGEAVLSVAHEALLNEWPLLRKMLEEQVAYLRRRERVTTAAAEWETEKRDPQRLATSVLLAEARLIRETEGADLPREISDFITLSVRRNRREMVRWLTTAAALVILFAGLAIWAVRAEREATARKRETQGVLSISDLSQAQRLFDADDSPAALVYLAHAIESDPERAVAAGDRLWFALSQRAWPLPISAPMKHKGEIATAFFSPDGRRVLTASKDKTARLWDAETGGGIGEPMTQKMLMRCAIFSPKGEFALIANENAVAQLWDISEAQPVARWSAKHDDSVNCAAFSHSGRWVATGTKDGKVRVLETDGGTRVCQVSGKKENVHTIFFSPTDDTLLLSVSGRIARLWRVPEGKELFALTHKEPIRSARFSADGKWIVTGTDGTDAQVWDTASGQPSGEPLKHDTSVSDAAFSPDGILIGTASGTQAVVWKAAGDHPEKLVLPHPATVTALRFSSDSLRLLTGSDDGRVQLWNALTGEKIGEPIRAGAAVMTAEFDPDGRRILVATIDGAARVWQTPALHPASDLMSRGGPIKGVAQSSDGARFLTIEENGKARLFDVAKRAFTATTLDHPSLECAAFSRDGTQIVTGGADAKARLWQADTGRAIGEPLPHESTSTVVAVQFRPDGRCLATATGTGLVQLWSLPKLEKLGDPITHEARITGLAFSADNQRLMTVSQDLTGRLWNAQSAAPASPPLPFERQANCVAASPRGSLFATGSSDGSAQLWDAAGQQGLRPFWHKDEVLALAFSQNGKHLATASRDKTAAIWDCATATPVCDSLYHVAGVTAVAFSPDGLRLATGTDVAKGKDGRDESFARLWDTTTGQPLSEWMRHPDAIRAMIFSADGRTLFSASADGVIRAWDIATGLAQSDREQLAKFARALSPARLQASGRTTPREIAGCDVLASEAKAKSTGQAAVLLNWFFSDSTQRKLTPFAATTVPRFIENRVAEGSPVALEEAATLSTGEAQAKIKARHTPPPP